MNVHWEDSFGERESERAEMQPRCSRGTAEIEPRLESRTGDIADGHLNAPPGLALLFALFFFGVLPTAISPYLPISPHISPYLITVGVLPTALFLVACKRCDRRG